MWRAFASLSFALLCFPLLSFAFLCFALPLLSFAFLSFPVQTLLVLPRVHYRHSALHSRDGQLRESERRVCAGVDAFIMVVDAARLGDSACHAHLERCRRELQLFMNPAWTKQTAPLVVWNCSSSATPRKASAVQVRCMPCLHFVGLVLSLPWLFIMIVHHGSSPWLFLTSSFPPPHHFRLQSCCACPHSRACGAWRTSASKTLPVPLHERSRGSRAVPPHNTKKNFLKNHRCPH